MKIEFVYRNYLPLYSHYFSFEKLPSPDLEIVIPVPQKRIQKLYYLYRRLKTVPSFSSVLNLGQRLLFSEGHDKTSDAYLFVGMLPSKKPDRPYLVDFEHANALMNFSAGAGTAKSRILRALENPLCKFILPWSRAADRSLRNVLRDDYSQISHKVRVVYPALECYGDLNKCRSHHEGPLKLLFVGKDGPRKGLRELLAAVVAVTDIENITLSVVTKNAQRLRQQYASHERISFFEADFTVSDLVHKFFLSHNTFVFPTLADTFGLVLLEAMSAGQAVVTTRQFSSPEIVNHEVDGLLIDNPPLFLDRPDEVAIQGEDEYVVEQDVSCQISEELVCALRRLNDDRMLARRIGSAALAQFKSGGRFSLATRNGILKQLFYDALNK